MAVESSIVADLGVSADNIVRYWGALRKRALAGMENPPAQAPVRSYLWPFLTYARSPWSSALPLTNLFDLEREEFSGTPMRDPMRFLERLGGGSSPKFTYATGEALRAAPNAKLREAMDLIAAIWPHAAKELDVASLGVAWIESPSGRVESSSDPKSFGIVHVNAEFFAKVSSHELATSLVHEAAHHALFVETSIDPLIPDDFKTPVYSPLRQEMRPAIGVLHAAFSISRMGQWAQKLISNGGNESDLNEVRRIRSKYVCGLGPALEGLKALRLSERGARVHQAMAGLVAPLEALDG